MIHELISSLEHLTLIELATLYAFNYAKIPPHVTMNPQAIMEELDRRQGILDTVTGLEAIARMTPSAPPDSREAAYQQLFSFAKKQNSGHNLSVEESYEAGYCAGRKAKGKELAALHDAAVKAEGHLVYWNGRPVVTQKMRQHLPCPFPHSEPEL